MAANTIQISAHVSKETKDRLDAVSRARGLKKAHLMEQALLHHMQAIEELPAGFIIPARIVLPTEAFQNLVEDLDSDEEPTEALIGLFHDD